MSEGQRNKLMPPAENLPVQDRSKIIRPRKCRWPIPSLHHFVNLSIVRTLKNPHKFFTIRFNHRAFVLLLSQIRPKEGESGIATIKYGKHLTKPTHILTHNTLQHKCLLAAKQIKNMADKCASTHQNGNIVEAKRDSNTNVKDTAKDPQDANGNDNENGHANAKGNKNGNGNAETPNQNAPSQRIKAPPICRVPALRKMNMSAEALSELCFEPEDVLDGTLTNKSTSNGTVAKDTNGQNNEKFNHNDDDDGMTSDQWAEFKNSILKRTESRNGRDHQRFDNDAKTGDLIRLTTGSVPIMKDGRILLVSSSRKEEWILPKGGWESDENIEVR